MTKYYFGWYNWYGKWFCERFSDIGCHFVDPAHRVEITEDEWREPLSNLEARYAHLKPDKA